MKSSVITSAFDSAMGRTTTIAVVIFVYVLRRGNTILPLDTGWLTLPLQHRRPSPSPPGHAPSATALALHPQTMPETSILYVGLEMMERFRHVGPPQLALVCDFISQATARP